MPIIKIPQSATAELVQRYLDGSSLAEIAAIYGVTLQAIAYRLMRSGIARRHYNTSIPDTRALIAQYESGATMAQLAQEYGMSAPTIKRHLVGAGVTPRSSAEVQRGKPRPHDQGPQSGKWKGGRVISPDGYVLIRKPGGTIRYRHEKPYEAEHRLVWEQAHGRKLHRDEVIHHINGDKTDNRLENLQLMTNTEHSALHAAQDRLKG